MVIQGFRSGILFFFLRLTPQDAGRRWEIGPPDRILAFFGGLRDGDTFLVLQPIIPIWPTRPDGYGRRMVPSKGCQRILWSE